MLCYIQSYAASDCITYQRRGGLAGASCDFSFALPTFNLYSRSCVSSHFRHTSETAHLSRHHPYYNDKSGTLTSPLVL